MNGNMEVYDRSHRPVTTVGLEPISLDGNQPSLAWDLRNFTRGSYDLAANTRGYPLLTFYPRP